MVLYRALGRKDFTLARPAAAFYTDRADTEFRLRRPLRHPTAEFDGGDDSERFQWLQSEA